VSRNTVLSGPASLYTVAVTQASLFLILILATRALAQTSNPPALTYVPGSSVKLYQVNGDCDWAAWDATITAKNPTCVPTASKTLTNADVLGDDVPVAFEHNGELIVTFGDTIGALGNGAWSDIQNSFNWAAHDPIARSTTANASDGLLLNFFLNGNHGLEVQPPPQPNGTPVDMGADNVPNTGVSVDGTIYLGIKTGAVTVSPGNIDLTNAYSVLATFDEATTSFTSGRTLSSLPSGHFVLPTFYLAPIGSLGSSPPVSPEPVMLIFGTGQYRASNVYLSIIPSSELALGIDAVGNVSTRYFSGMTNGQPTWSVNEANAAPIVTDLDPAHPTIGNVTVSYSQALGLWLMMYDGGRGSVSTTGIYFTSAPQPWGPWATPQLIFNDCRDNGFGNFVFYYYATAAQNDCPSAMPAGVISAPNSAGPSGPTIGQTDPTTARGGAYAPAIVERFTILQGSSLKLFYMFATWNPYAVVMMESDFTITRGPVISEVANAEGESQIIAPNTWLEIKGQNLAPPGDTRIWLASDFSGNAMPAQLDKVSATVNGQNAYVYYISPTQVNILSPPNPISGPVEVALSNNGAASTLFTVQAQSISPSFFVFNGGPYVAAEHLNGSLIGPATLYPGASTPAAPGETIVIYANGFGPTNIPVTAGSVSQSGTLSPLPAIAIGGQSATVTFAGLVAPGEFQFNVVVPSKVSAGDQPIVATYGGQSTQSKSLITIQ
jgi:uncharacterized protein (TIGR03437 family)